MKMFQNSLKRKKIIEDEKNNNPITVSELEDRMRDFLDKDYKAYFFSKEMKLSLILLSGFHLLLFIKTVLY